MTNFINEEMKRLAGLPLIESDDNEDGAEINESAIDRETVRLLSAKSEIWASMNVIKRNASKEGVGASVKSYVGQHLSEAMKNIDEALDVLNDRQNRK